MGLSQAYTTERVTLGPALVLATHSPSDHGGQGKKGKWAGELSAKENTLTFRPRRKGKKREVGRRVKREGEPTKDVLLSQHLFPPHTLGEELVDHG